MIWCWNGMGQANLLSAMTVSDITNKTAPPHPHNLVQVQRSSISSTLAIALHSIVAISVIYPATKYSIMPSIKRLSSRKSIAPTTAVAPPWYGFKGRNPKARAYCTWATANMSKPNSKYLSGQTRQISPRHENTSPMSTRLE